MRLMESGVPIPALRTSILLVRQGHATLFAMVGKLTIQQIRAVVLSLLVGTALVTGGVYLHRTRGSSAGQPLPLPRLPPNVTQSAGFRLSKSEGGRTVFTVKALRAREQRDTGKSLLEDVEIITFGAQGDRRDRIFSKLCEYDAKTGLVYSEGEVEIELASLPGEFLAATGRSGKSPARSVAGEAGARIHVWTSGLTFNEKTGVASTERLVRFRFLRGTGQAKGAVYDSNQRTLRLTSAVQILVQKPGTPQPPEDQPSKIEILAKELVHLQRQSQVLLRKLRIRQTLAGGGSRELLGEEALLRLDEQNRLQAVEVAGQVQINESVPGATPGGGRQSRLTAKRLDLLFNEQHLLDQVHANEAVRLEVVTPRSRAEFQAARLELFFGGPQNTLSQVDWKGGVRIVFTPTAAEAPVRVLTSEEVEMILKPGRQELDVARTLAPGRLELLPPKGPVPAHRGRPTRRVLTADRLWMQFGEQSQLRVLRAEQGVRLESEAPVPAPRNQAAGGSPRLPTPTPRITTSDLLVAHFSQASQQLEVLEQTGNFHYTDGERQATAERAVYRAAERVVTLTGRPGRNPEVWDRQSRTSARQITLDEDSKQGTAKQQVRSTYLPQQNSGSAGAGPLSGSDPVHVIAERMVSQPNRGVIRYEGGPGQGRVRLWQKGEVIEARTLVLEREPRRLTAQDEVVTLFPEAGAKSEQQARSPIRISAQRLVYTDQDRRAHYQGGVLLRQGDSVVKAATLEAHLLPANQEQAGHSCLQRAVARGGVEIVDFSAGQQRRGAADMAEYFASEEKVILRGGQPYVYDPQRGYTRGAELTYYIRDDRIFVDGDGETRTVTEHRVRTRQQKPPPQRP